MLNHSKYYILLLILFCLSLNVQAKTTSVAYVQVARLLAEPPQVKQVREKLQAEFATRDSQLDEQQSKIQALQDKLTQEGIFLNKEEAKRLERDILARSLKLKHARKELQQQRQLRQDDEIEHLRKMIREVIAEVAKEADVDLVLESGALWVSEKTDITEKVLKRLQTLATGLNP